MDNALICTDILQDIVNILIMDDFKAVWSVALTCRDFSKIIAKRALEIANKHVVEDSTEVLGRNALIYQLPNGVNHGVQYADYLTYINNTVGLIESTETWIIGKRVGYHTRRIYGPTMVPSKLIMYSCSAQSISKIKIKIAKVNAHAQVDSVHSIYIIIDGERREVNSINDIIFHMIEQDVGHDYSSEYVQMTLDI